MFNSLLGISRELFAYCNDFNKEVGHYLERRGSFSICFAARWAGSGYAICAVFLRYILPVLVAFLRNDASQSPCSGLTKRLRTISSQTTGTLGEIKP
jgi:hypothetical protein